MALILSLGIHFFLLFSVSLYITKKRLPVIYSWLDILDKKALFLKKKNISLPEELNLSSDTVRKDYFLSFLPPREEVYYFPQEKKIYPQVYLKNYAKRKTEYLYLWDRSSLIFPLAREEKVSYKVFVSRQGKIIFSFPNHLTVNSHHSVYFQEYVREAALFLNDRSDRFFWTNLEGVIK